MAIEKLKDPVAMEKRRRNRVVKGWAFRSLSEKQVKEIRRYLNGGPVPAGYERLDEVIR